MLGGAKDYLETKRSRIRMDKAMKPADPVPSLKTIELLSLPALANTRAPKTVCNANTGESLSSKSSVHGCPAHN